MIEIKGKKRERRLKSEDIGMGEGKWKVLVHWIRRQI